MLRALFPALRRSGSAWGVAPCASRRMSAGASKMEVIKELRERSGAPMMDVKNALAEAQWDIGTVPGHCLLG